jgi:hypothetical protein
MNLKLAVISIAIACTLSACSMKSKEEVAARNQHLTEVYKRINVYKNPYGLDSTIQKECDSRIRALYIKNLYHPDSWKVTKQLAPLDFANADMYDYRQELSQRMGFDTSNMLAFMAQYEGDSSIGISLGLGMHYICVIDIKKNTMQVHSTETDLEFKRKWGIDPKRPIAW